MRGTRVKQLRRELSAKLGRAPQKAGIKAWWDGKKFHRIVVPDEFRAYKRRHKSVG